MKTSRVNRRVRKAVCQMEWLESRCLLSATVTAQIPAQNVAAGAASAPISLGTYFDDPIVTGTAVVLETNLGNIPLVLTDSATPQTVANFTSYITSGEYNGTIIHRSVPGFIIQGGGYTTSGTHISTDGTIPGESATATLKNTTGTIAMALSSGPNSATSEWFINLANNPPLDEANTMASDYDGGPFTAFGQVVYRGMSVVDAIAALPIVDDTLGGQDPTQSTDPLGNVPVQSGANGATVTSEPATNLVTLNAEIIPGGLTYSVVSSNPSLVTGSVDPSTGDLTLAPVNGGGMANITVIATDMGGNTATDTFAVDVTNASPIVTIGGAGAKTCTYTDASGAVTTVTLKGNGTTTLDFAGSNLSQTTVGKVTSITGSGLGLSSITTAGTTSASVLSITTRGGSGAVNVGSIATDALNAITAKGVSVTGDIDSSSAIGTITLGSATGGIISAVSLGNITVSGAFSDGVSLTGSGQSLKAFKAGSITGGTWDLAGSALSVTTGSVSNWSPDFSQSLKTLSVKGDFNGSLTAGSVGTITISGAANNSLFHFSGTGTDLSKITLGGVFSSSVINSLGSIGSFTAEALVSGEVYAGVGNLGDQMVLPASVSDFAVDASIGSVKLKGAANGESFANSDIAATMLGVLTLGTLDTNNGGAATGIVGESLKSLTATANKKFALKNDSGSSDIASILTADGVVLGDVIIDLIQPPTPG